MNGWTSWFQILFENDSKHPKAYSAKLIFPYNGHFFIIHENPKEQHSIILPVEVSGLLKLEATIFSKAVNFQHAQHTKHFSVL